MKCYQCGGEYQEKRGALQLTDEWIGNLAVDGVHYYECDSCEDLLLPPETMEILDSKREQVLADWINSQPIESFLNATQTAHQLRISRQALHKHIRIRRGFIYQTKFYGRTVYLRRSVLLFMTTGDGRFPLPLESRTSVPGTSYQFSDETRNTPAFRSERQLEAPEWYFNELLLTETLPEDRYHA